MKTTHLAQYVDQYLAEFQPNFQWKVVQNNEQHIMELFFTFKVNVEKDIQVQDEEGKLNDPGVIQFEDVICFYDPAVSHVSPQHYMKSFEMNYRTGIEKGFVDAVLKHLNIVATQGSAELRDFAADDTMGQFRLQWDERNFEGTLETLKATNRYDRTHLQFTQKEEEKSFIDKIKKEDDSDDVERI